jgi:2-alkenal reductase
LNDQGQLIGVTSAIISPARVSSGVGFAIPSNIVQEVVPSLIETGTFQHPWLGISGDTLTPDLAEAMGLNSNQQGALVVDVTAGGPAAKAGLRGSTRQVTIMGQRAAIGGDVIVAINGRPVKSFDDVVTNLASMRVGQKTTLTVLRGGKETTIRVTLEARPQQLADTQNSGSN